MRTGTFFSELLPEYTAHSLTFSHEPNAQCSFSTTENDFINCVILFNQALQIKQGNKQNQSTSLHRTQCTPCERSTTWVKPEERTPFIKTAVNSHHALQAPDCENDNREVNFKEEVNGKQWHHKKSQTNQLNEEMRKNSNASWCMMNPIWNRGIWASDTQFAQVNTLSKLLQ